ARIDVAILRRELTHLAAHAVRAGRGSAISVGQTALIRAVRAAPLDRGGACAFVRLQRGGCRRISSAIGEVTEAAGALAVERARLRIVDAADARGVAAVRLLAYAAYCRAEALVVARAARALRGGRAARALVRAADARLAGERGLVARVARREGDRLGSLRIEHDVEHPR